MDRGRRQSPRRFPRTLAGIVAVVSGWEILKRSLAFGGAEDVQPLLLLAIPFLLGFVPWCFFVRDDRIARRSESRDRPPAPP
jgi:hypothetical protein